MAQENSTETITQEESHHQNGATRALLIMVSFIVVFFLIDFFAVRFTQKSMQDNVLHEVQAVLNGQDTQNKYIVAGFVDIPSMLSTSCALLRININDRPGETVDTKYAAVMRIATIAGPFMALFLCNNDGNDAQFVSYLGASGRVLDILNSNVSIIPRKYWAKKASAIIKSVQLSPQAQ